MIVKWKCLVKLGTGEPFTQRKIIVETSAPTLKEAEAKLLNLLVELESISHYLIEYSVKKIQGG